MKNSFLPKLLLLSGLAACTTFYCHAQRESAPTAPKDYNPGDFRQGLKIDDSPVKRSEPLMKSYADILDKVEPSVVKISTYQTVEFRSPTYFDMQRQQFFRGQRQQKDIDTGLGSGVIVNKNGFVITNNHVIERATKIKVLVPGHEQEYDAEVIDRDPSQDVAVIKILGQNNNFPSATFADSSQARRGDIVFALGAPFGYEQSASMGIVSSVGKRSVGVIGDGQETLIQTDAAVNPGNSGGPLVDAEGRVLGINTAIYSNTGSTAGIGFAIPINRVIQVATRLVAGEEKDMKGYLGVSTEDVNPKIAEILEMPSSDGALVSQVHPDSPAQAAGLQVDDVILDLQGRKVASHTQLSEEIRNFPAGREINLGVWRDSKRIDIKLTLGDLDTILKASNPAVAKAPDSAPTNEFGLKLGKLTDEWRTQLQLSELAEGVVIEEVLPDSSAARIGLQRGDLITRVHTKDVASVKDATEALADKTKGGMAMLKIFRDGQTARAVLERTK